MKGSINRFVYISIFLLLVIGAYHFIAYLDGAAKIDIDLDPNIYFIYNFAYNALIINCLLLIRRVFKTIGSQLNELILYFPKILSSYFALKILINILFLFPKVRTSNVIDHNELFYVLAGAILAIFITLKIFSKNEKKDT